MSKVVINQTTIRSRQRRSPFREQMLSSLFYMPYELHPRMKVIVYVTFLRLNEANFANCGQLEPKNIILKSKTQIVQCRKRKLQSKTENHALRSEIAVSERNTKYFACYLMFREIPDFPIGNHSFRATYKIFTT